MPSGTATRRTPLPKLQLTIAVLIQAAEALSATVIFPFVPQFVRDTGITGGDERKTGYWAGVLESIFFIAEFICVYAWSLGSDTFGRRPILLLGPLGLAISLFGFGLSKTFTGLLLWRCAQGVFNGNIGVVKTVMAEFSDQSNLAQAMAFIPVAWSSGTTLGPILGGLLSEPAARFPALAEKFPLLKIHPYFLPCAAVGVICLGIFLLGVVGMRETSPIILARQKRARDKLSADLEPTPATGLLADSPEAGYGTTTEYDDSEPQEAEDERIPTLRELLVPRLSIPLLNYGFFCFSQTAYQVLLPLMYSTSIPLGGLCFTPYEIGVVRGIWGVCNTIFQLFLSAPIIAFFGPRRSYIFGFTNFTVCIGTYPAMSYFAQRAGQVDGMVWALVVLQGIANLCISMSYVTSQMYIVTSAPRPSALSSTNSIAQMVSTILRGLAPFLASALFAFSLERGSQLVYVFLLGIVGLGMYTSLLLPRDLKG
ncbi:major facilitator superfamily domain-containing protein [Mycena amicta]|nr:major facilitator superfamily domain-containing protein [Mycena amicta]